MGEIMKKILFSFLILLSFLSVSVHAMDEKEKLQQLEMEAYAKNKFFIDFDCSLNKQDCAEGQGCYLTTQGTRCLHSAYYRGGQACKHLNDCAPGFMCSGALNKKCHKVCMSDDDCGNGGICVGSLTPAEGGTCVR